MPGTPPTTPRLGVARFATSDPDQVPIDLNTIVDRLDLVVGYFSHGPLAARPSTGAGIVDRFYFADDEGVLYRDAGGATPTWTAINPRTRALVTALPGSPFTGQEILFQDATILAPANIIWPLRYDGTKWVPIGQATPLNDEITTGQTTASTTYTDLTTVGPQITLPLAGDYDITFGFQGSNTSAGFVDRGTVKLGAAAASDNESAQVNNPNINLAISTGRTLRRTGLAAAATLKMQYDVNGGTGSFGMRFLQVRPVRLG